MCPVSLTDQDRSGLVACMDTLLSPFDYSHVDEWRAEVNRSLASLLYADMATFEVPTPEGDRLYSRDIDVQDLRAYYPMLDPLARRFGIYERYRTLRVADRNTLWGPHLDEYLRSAYYNEFIVSLRAFDGLFAFATPPGHSPAILYFHHERPEGRRFDSRELQLLHLIYPAFEAGVTNYLALAEHRRSFERAVDQFSHPALLFDLHGRLVHRNRPFTKMEAAHPNSEELLGELRRWVLSVGAARRGEADDVLGGLRNRVVEVPASPSSPRAEAYAVGATSLGSHVLGKDYLLLTLTPLHQRLPTPSDLRNRFRLTPRQAEVALLLARRRTNREVAEELLISPHTARRHTEKVLMKLDIASRRQVREEITNPSGDGRSTKGRVGPSRPGGTPADGSAS